MARSEMYKKAGVDIDTASLALKKAKKFIRSTFNKNVAVDIGSFGGVYKIDKDKCVVSSIDGVGTKLKIAQALNVHTTVGQDIVNHCTNDILVMGARPLFFLDYFGCGRLNPQVFSDVIRGISKACRENGCVLIGGETAEMPGMYAVDDYDLVGTIIGEIDVGRIITGSAIKPGDVVLGLQSTGLHTNGYSLVRKIFETAKIPYNKYVKDLNSTPGKALLKIHKSYFNSVYPALQKYFRFIHGLAHLTGGGFYDNIIRVLPDNCTCVCLRGTWDVLPIFDFIQKTGNVSWQEMHRVFNMGIGMVVITDKVKAKEIERFLQAKGERVFEIGQIINGKKEVVIE